MAIYPHRFRRRQSAAIIAAVCLTSFPAAGVTVTAQELEEPIEIQAPEVAEQTASPVESPAEVTAEPEDKPTAAGVSETPAQDSDNALTVAATTPAQWAGEYYELTVGSATVQVQKDVSTNGTVRLVGSGWTNDAGSGSTVTIKVNYLKDGSTVQYRRGTADTGKPGDSSDILNHPGNGNPDATIFWQFQANADGTFDIEEQLPVGLTTGQSLKLNIASGLVAGDTQRSVNTPSLVVNGVAYVEEANNKPECVPSTKPPSATIASAPSSTNTLLITGKGFCNTNGGGAKVAIKIDEGRVERLDTSIHSNQTIWAIVDADSTTGDFSYEMPLPDGTTAGPNGSKTAFGQGEHTIRILSGSLQDGDIPASVPPRGSMLSFTVGQYSPPGVPDPVNYNEHLIASAQQGVTANRKGSDIEVTVPNGKEGDWVFASTYLDNGSPRLPWRSQWFQLDAAGKVVLPGNTSIPAGPLRLVLQNGNKGEFGKLLGWTTFKYTDAATAGTSTSTSTSAASKSGAGEYDKVFKELNSALLKAATAADEVEKTRKQKASTSATPTPEAANTVSAAPSNSTTQPQRATAVTTNRTGGSPVRPATGTGAAGGGRIAGANAGGSGASYDPKPTTDPKAPVKNRNYLTNDNSHDVSGKLTGENLSIKVPKLKVGQWAYLYVYSADLTQKPVGAGWVQIDTKGEVHLDTSQLPDGEYTVAAVGNKDELLGWIDITLGNVSQPVALAADDGTTTTQPTQLAASSGMMTSTDWWLIAASIMIPLATAGVLYIFRRPSLRAQALAYADKHKD